MNDFKEKKINNKNSNSPSKDKRTSIKTNLVNCQFTIKDDFCRNNVKKFLKAKEKCLAYMELTDEIEQEDNKNNNEDKLIFYDQYRRKISTILEVPHQQIKINKYIKKNKNKITKVIDDEEKEISKIISEIN